jgi:hypothetical protein
MKEYPDHFNQFNQILNTNFLYKILNLHNIHSHLITRFSDQTKEISCMLCVICSKNRPIHSSVSRLGTKYNVRKSLQLYSSVAFQFYYDS